MNIASLVVRVRPEFRSTVGQALAAMPGVEIAYCAVDGPLILTVEDAPPRTAIETITEINGLAGVIAAGLSYHYTDDFLDQTQLREKSS